MHKPPEKLKRGWRRHVEAHNALIDYAYKTHPIPAHGHQETVNGTMPPAPALERLMQFTPTFHAKAGDVEPRLEISPGYVFAASGTGTHLPASQQWVHEPTINDIALTAASPPTLQLEAGQINVIYLQLIWDAHQGDIGGHIFETIGGETEYAFPVTYNLKVDGLPDETGETTVSGETAEGDACVLVGHSHAIDNSTVGEVIDGDPVVSNPAGVFLQAIRYFYTLASAKFVLVNSLTPPTETEGRTYVCAGYVNLTESGEIKKQSNDDDGLRWFLNGAYWAAREPIMVTGYTDPDRVEPLEPEEPEASTLKPPGIS